MSHWLRPMFGLALLIMALVPGALSSALAQTPGAVQEYRVGPKDVLKVTVWGHEDLTRLVVVSADGTFQFPLVGDVAVGGLTPGEVGALTVAGGFTEKAGQSQAKLIRRSASGQEQTVSLDLSRADPAARDFPSGTAIRS